MGKLVPSVVKKVSREMLLAGVFFVLWVSFFDEYNLISHFRDQQKLEQLIKQKEFLQDKIQSDQRKIRELQTSHKNLEKFAREQFLMKKKNEDVFLVVEEE
ncbi:MAG: septum formation initiator family protein [Mangrovibacterium sp.]|nr:septum formation initiator family protein [Mangrovibacterium sp.]